MSDLGTGTATGPVRRIGRYTIEQVIGTGAFATVYRATDERLDATVAIKLLADNHCLDPDIRALRRRGPGSPPGGQPPRAAGVRHR